ncbi:MAG TPA: glycerophosphodiester phosphodiesterase family protein, partial [Usitatibacteraceae bacterium]|nr:glycerophosphodiester phosphodiesterase family protein [Usitatibacteraceae bacterium]
AQACVRLWQSAAEPPLLSSFSRESLEAARAAAPDLPRGWLVETPGEEDFAFLDAVGAASLHCSHKAVTPSLVARVHAGGRRLLAWTVNDPGRAEDLLALGVDGLFTDSLLVFAGRFPDYR